LAGSNSKLDRYGTGNGPYLPVFQKEKFATGTEKYNVEDPDTDQDPAFQVNPDQDLIRIQGFDDQKLEKKMQQIF
jgi:hypothetical protein